LALEIAVGGCGVAGLAFATLMARAGARVVLFDKLETPSPLGSGLILQPVGMAALAELGLDARMHALGARIDRLFGRAHPSGHVVLDVRYAALGAARGLAVHRGALFGALYQAARDAGVTMETSRDIVGVGDGRFTFADGRQSARFDLVVDALGVRSPLSTPGAPLDYGALWASLDWPDGDTFDAHALEQRYEQAHKMVGVLPIGRLDGGAATQAAFFWSLRADREAAWRAQPIEAWKEAVRALWPQTEPFLAQIARHDDLVFARYAHRTLRSPLSPGVVHIGDSWHCTSPQLGQGANTALLDAFALARALQRHRDIPAALTAYARMRSWHVRVYQSASWLFTPVYQSDSRLLPLLRDRIAGPLSKIWPAPVLLAALVAGVWGAPLRSLGLGHRTGAAPLPGGAGMIRDA
jgi:2-polyprenyl-6-methoxyphenol hydroxylase-like FAD-dependent oxidoreductase